jgi:serine/threonine protein kinase
MAPEIMRGESYDESSDVYSYGIILWELLNKEIPWSGIHMLDLID